MIIRFYKSEKPDASPPPPAARAEAGGAALVPANRSTVGPPPKAPVVLGTLNLTGRYAPLDPPLLVDVTLDATLLGAKTEIHPLYFHCGNDLNFEFKRLLLLFFVVFFEQQRLCCILITQFLFYYFYLYSFVHKNIQ